MPGDAYDVTVFEVFFDAGYFRFGDHFDFHGCHFALGFGHEGAEFWVVFEVAVVFPEERHFVALVWHGGGGEFFGDVLDVFSFVVVCEPFCEVVNAVKVVSITGSATVAGVFYLSE